MSDEGGAGFIGFFDREGPETCCQVNGREEERILRSRSGGEAVDGFVAAGYRRVESKQLAVKVPEVDAEAGLAGFLLDEHNATTPLRIGLADDAVSFHLSYVSVYNGLSGFSMSRGGMSMRFGPLDQWELHFEQVGVSGVLRIHGEGTDVLGEEGADSETLRLGEALLFVHRDAVDDGALVDAQALVSVVAAGVNGTGSLDLVVDEAAGDGSGRGYRGRTV